MTCWVDRVACGRRQSAACPVVGGPAEGASAQAGCDRSRVKTKKKEKQNDFLTETCHSRLGVPRSSLLQVHQRPPTTILPAGRPLNPSRQAPPPASRRRLVGALPPPVIRDARQAGRPPRLAEGGRSEEHTSELQ